MKSVIDVSNLNGMGFRSLAEYQRADGLYVQAIPRPRPNGIVAQQLYAGRDDGKALGIYSWLWHDPTWRMAPDLRTDQRLRLATVPNDVQLTMRPMIDVEDNQSTGWQSVSVQQRKDDLMICLDVLHAFSTARNLPDPGIYWSDYYINLLFDGWMPDGVFQWKAHYGIQAGSVIGGLVVGHQFSSTPIDQSVFIDSELQTQAPPVPRRPLTLKGPGVDLDPLVAGADLDPKQLATMGFTWARLVERDDPRVRAYADALTSAGVTPVGVVTGETQGRILPNVRIKILGNEMDTAESNPAKWPAGDAVAYRSELDTYAGTFPDFDWIIGGLASGDPNAGYLRDVLRAGPLPACVVGLSMHPWAKNADEARGWIRQVKAAAGNLPVILGEYNRPANEIPGYVGMAQEEVVAFGWYCLSDVQSLGSEGQRFGLFDVIGQPKDELHALQTALGTAPAPSPTPTPPQPTPTPTPTPDLKALADALEQAAAYLRQQAA